MGFVRSTWSFSPKLEEMILEKCPELETISVEKIRKMVELSKGYYTLRGAEHLRLSRNTPKEFRSVSFDLPALQIVWEFEAQMEWSERYAEYGWNGKFHYVPAIRRDGQQRSDLTTAQERVLFERLGLGSRAFDQEIVGLNTQAGGCRNKEEGITIEMKFRFPFAYCLPEEKEEWVSAMERVTRPYVDLAKEQGLVRWMRSTYPGNLFSELPEE